METQAQLLAHLVDQTRQMTMFYSSKLKGQDLHKVFKTESGMPFNTAFWLLAHLAVTENFMLLRSTGGQPVKIAWNKQFSLGSSVPTPEESPSLDEVLSTLKEVHQNSLAHIRSLTDEQLAAPNTTGFSFGTDTSIKGIIVHAIRHEGTHAGHLGWLCKMHGVPTI